MGRRRTWIDAVSCGAAIAALLVAPAPVHAHSTLTSSQPAGDSTVPGPVEEVVLEFSDPVVVPDGVVAVFDLYGTDFVQAGVEVDDTTVRIPIEDVGEPGTRVVAWNAISDHGTEISGSFAYHVDGLTAGARGGAAALAGSVREREVVELTRALAGTGVAFSVAAIVWAMLRRRRGRASRAGAAVVAGCGSIAVVAAGVGIAVGGSAFVAGAGEPPIVRVERVLSFKDGGEAVVALDPSVVGTARIDVDLRAANGDPDDAAEGVHVRYRPADERIGFFRTQLESDGDGSFFADRVVVPFDGAWKFEVVVSRDRFSAALATFEADVHPNPELAR